MDPIVLNWHDSVIRQSDVELLRGPHWLNDVIVSFWLEYIQRELCLGSHGVLFVGAEVTQLVKLSEEHEICLFLDPLNAHESDYLAFPINDNCEGHSAGGSHWSLLAYSRKEDAWIHYDSSGGAGNITSARMVCKRVSGYLDSKTNASGYLDSKTNVSGYLDSKTNASGYLEDIPRHRETSASRHRIAKAVCTQQNNSYDCGVFLLLNAQHLASCAQTGTELGENLVQRWQTDELRTTICETIQRLAKQ